MTSRQFMLRFQRVQGRAEQLNRPVSCCCFWWAEHAVRCQIPSNVYHALIQIDILPC
ncbi:hypothetical protein electrica_02763 [Klebsiella electrica]|nr:hypothetical protein electrica_02763 [Klebsiella electrica]